MAKETKLSQSSEKHAQRVEGLLLAALIQSETSWQEIFDLIDENDFSLHSHRAIFEAIRIVASETDSYDATVIADKLKLNNKLESAGGVSYLLQLIEENPSTAHVKTYAEIIKNSSLLRQLVQFGEKIINLSHNPNGKTAKELITSAEADIFNLNEYGKKRLSVIHISTAALKVQREILENRAKEGDFTGLSTGFHNLDEKIMGLNPGNLVVLAARPSMGKTALATNIAQSVASAKHPVLFFSLEMSSEELHYRILSGLTKISHTKLKTGKVTEKELEKVKNIARDFQIEENFPLFIEGDSTLNPTEILSLSRMIKRKHNLGLIIIDYIQLMTLDTKEMNRVSEISKITRSLKHLAKELNIPVIALSQVSRDLEKRGGGSPKLSDLRDSGSIEQDADIVIFIQQEERQYQKSNIVQGKLLIEKNRHGGTGFVDVEFNRELVSFYSLKEELEMNTELTNSEFDSKFDIND